MYAIIQAGGRQMRVAPGGFATIDGTAGEPGATLTIEQVLLVEKDGGEILAGAPFVANARVIVAACTARRYGARMSAKRKKKRWSEMSTRQRGVAWAKRDGNWCAIDRHGRQVPGIACTDADPIGGPGGRFECKVEP